MRQTTPEDVSRIMALGFEGDGDEQQRTPLPPTEQPIQPQIEVEYDVYVEPEQHRITFIKKEPPTVEAIKPTPPNDADEKPFLSHQASAILACCTIMVSLFLIGTCLCLQFSLLLNPPTAIITIIPTPQQITRNDTLPMGRVLTPITLSQSQTVTTTGHGHQDARAATGWLTLYNGQLQGVAIAAGTVLTGADGVQVVTDQRAIIPPGNPPTYGQITVSAHALGVGTYGNIQAGDIHLALSGDLLAKNLAPFTGGQDERDFRIVAETDVTTTAQPLTTVVTQSMQAAFQGQLTTGEEVHLLPCRPTTTADHGIGEEATQITVTVTLTCSAVAYNEQTLRAAVAQLLTTQAVKQLATSYTLEELHITIHRAASHPPHVLLSVTSRSTWVYAIPSHQQERIKSLVKGKTVQAALQLLRSFPGIQSARIGGIPGVRKLPTDPSQIHLLLLVEGEHL